MNRIAKIFTIPVFVAAQCFSQTSTPNGAVIGCVYDLESNSSLARSWVQIDSLKLGAATNNAGKFIILHIPPGVYDIRAGSTAGFYHKTYLRVKIAPDSITFLSFGLTNTAIPENPLPFPWEELSIKRIESLTVFFGRGKIFDFQCGL